MSDDSGWCWNSSQFGQPSGRRATREGRTVVPIAARDRHLGSPRTSPRNRVPRQIGNYRASDPCPGQPCRARLARSQRTAATAKRTTAKSPAIPPATCKAPRAYTAVHPPPRSQTTVWTSDAGPITKATSQTQASAVASTIRRDGDQRTPHHDLHTVQGLGIRQPDLKRRAQEQLAASPIVEKLDEGDSLPSGGPLSK